MSSINSKFGFYGASGQSEYSNYTIDQALFDCKSENPNIVEDCNNPDVYKTQADIDTCIQLKLTDCMNQKASANSEATATSDASGIFAKTLEAFDNIKNAIGLPSKTTPTAQTGTGATNQPVKSSSTGLYLGIGALVLIGGYFAVKKYKPNLFKGKK